MTETDVIITGGGPTGLMLAAELRLAGISPSVLERHRRPGETPKANGSAQRRCPVPQRSPFAVVRSG